MFAAHPVLDVLLREGLVTSEDVVDGALTLEAVASSRHRSFRLTRTTGPDLFVKQAFSAQTAPLVAREAQFYANVAPTLVHAMRWLPRLEHYSPSEATLVVELVGSGWTLTRQQARGRFSVAVASKLGGALAALHSTAFGQDSGRGIPRPDQLALKPHGLDLHRPWLANLADMTPSSIAFVRLLQGTPGLVDLLDEAAADWAVGRLVHGDLKGDNIVVIRSRTGRAVDVRLVDWESAGAGDSAWDVGCMLADYVCTWLRSIPASGNDSPTSLASSARVPLASVLRPMNVAWLSYLNRSPTLGPADVQHLLARAVRYAGVRVLQAVSEELQVERELLAPHVSMTQLGVNLIKRPQEGAVRLLGLSLHGERL